MHSVQRQFGKFMKRTPDHSKVSVLLKDFEDADKLLTRIIDSSKAWRDAWFSTLTYQCSLAKEFEGLYAPIVGCSDSSFGRPRAVMPQETLERMNKFHEEYEDLKADLLQEVNAVEDRITRPAAQAKDYMAPMKKTIKKREDKKLDYEHYQGRVDNYMKKMKRSDRDNAALAKSEVGLAKAKQEYDAMDDHLRQHLPQLIAAVFSLLPQLLAAQIEIQNTLLAHSYTMLHNFCQQEQFPSPPPPTDEVIQVWERDFLPIQRQVESLSCIANGKATRQQNEHRNSTQSNVFSLAKHRPSSRHLRGELAPPSPDTKPRVGSSGSSSSITSPTPPSDTLRPPSSSQQHLRPPTPDYPASESSFDGTDHSQPQSTSPSTSTTSTSASTYQMAVGFSPAAPNMDYFSRDRQPSVASSTTSPSLYSSPSTPGSSVLSIIAKKKKPPPPPPRPADRAPALFVTALYDFAGQGEGHLVFREGDRIEVLKKTESTDDWWEGELRGVRGRFPPNYCDREFWHIP
ncbi:hypothetical protein VTN00DRAFT_1237 [Thermoascus crustaceus]|uniref:uncharacterized protein n=1 Tax=Thermoascus crustaceus TaxID=5088 RepID=UPI003744352D